ncbi:DNA repair protein RecO C-terminal domain-containing protein, partial [Mycoplasmopsis bovis]|uniref:DNA repair protein RecO C-terminal domain-containing protein n=1 Tax=Mycoplasmopsis bovis TaxID=28903 RepID=UPI003D2987C2
DSEAKEVLKLVFKSGDADGALGIQPNHHRCISCNSPANLIDFKFSEGGFICGECTNNQRWTKELKSLYFLFNSLDKYILMSNKAVNDFIVNNVINCFIA